MLPMGAPFSESHTGLPRTSASANRAHLCQAPTLAINGRVGVTRRGWLPSCGSQARTGRKDQAEEGDLVFQLRSTEREGSESHQEAFIQSTEVCPLGPRKATWAAVRGTDWGTQ